MLLAKQSTAEQLNDWADVSQDSLVARTQKRRPVKKPFPNRFVSTLVIVLCLVIANIFFQALVIQQNQEIKVWQGKINQLERYSTKLRIEMANLESFERIQTAAQKDLGMRVPGPDDYLCIEAVPENHSQKPQSYDTYSNKPASQGNLWHTLAGWIEGIGETMAQTQ